MSKETTATRRTGAAGTIDVSQRATEATDIHVLIIDDSEDDALVTIRELKRGGYSPTFERVDTAEAMVSALKSGHWDVIICDYIMPSFSGLAALNVFKASGLDLPFILVSGKVGEERAVEAMRAGATDYVMKDKLNRLVPAIKRELGEVNSRREYRKVAQSLKQSEDRYQALAENYSDVIWVTDMNRQTTYISPSITRLLGYSVEEIMAHGIELTPASLKASLNATAQALSTKQAGKVDKVLRIPPLELEMKHRDGSTAWASTSFSFIPDSDGRPVEIVAVLQDITASKKASDILRASEERLKILFEFAPDAYYLNDMEAKLVDGNRAAEKLTGYKRKELIGKSFLELGLISDDQIPKAAALLDRNLEGQSTGPDEFVLKRKDGSLVNVEINTFPATINGQRLVLGIVRDITENKRMEGELQRQERHFRALIENSSDAIIVADSDGTTRYVSPSLRRMLGEGRFGAGILEAVHPEDVQVVADDFASLLQNPGATSLTEVRIQHKDGSWHTIESTATNLIHDPAVQGVVINLRDITERKRAEEVLHALSSRQQALLDAIPDIIVEVDKNKVFTWTNPAGLEFYGDDVIGKEAAFYFEGEQDTYSTITPLFGGSEDVIYVESWQRRKDGEKRLLAWWCRALKDNGGNVIGALSTARDITERRRIEAALRESEKRYRLLAENVSDVIWVTDMKLRPVYTSPSIARLLGYSAEESLTRKMEDSLTPASLKQAAETFAKLLSLKEAAVQEGFGTRPLELEFIRKDGSTIWTATTVSVMRDPDGQPNAIMGVLHNISERKQAEEVIRESEARYRLLAENLSDVIWIMDTNYKYSYISPSVTHLRGYSVEEAMALSMEETITPASLETVMRDMAEAQAKQPHDQRASVTMELELNCKDGSTVWVENRVTFLCDSDGRLTGYLGVSRDITERRKAEESIRESETRFKALFEYAPDGIYLNDLQGNILDFNKAAQETLGYTKEEVLGKNFLELGLLSADQIERGVAALQSTMTKLDPPEQLASHEFVLNHRDGRKVTAEIKTIPVKVNGKDVMIGIVRDITESKRMKEVLQQQERHFRALIERSSDVVVVLDKDGTTRYVSPSVEHMFGVKPEQTLGAGFAASTHPDEMQAAAEGWAYLMEHPGATTHEERRVRHADDSWHYVEAISHNLLDDPAVQGIVINLRDITERKQLEETLRQSEQRWKGIFDHTLDGMVIYDPDSGKTVLANQAAADVFGFDTVKRIIGTTSMDYIPEEDREQVMREIAEAMAGGLKKVRDIRIRTEDGRMVWASVLPTMTNYQGKPAILMSIRDITDRKLAEEAVKESEKHYRLLAENASDVISVVGMDLKPKYMSPSTTRLLGYTVEEAMANGMGNGLTPASFQVAAEAFEKAIAEGQKQKPMTMDLEMKRKDGSTVWVTNSVTFIRDSEGKPVEILSNLHDITERKKSEEVLRQSEQRWKGIFDHTLDGMVIHDPDSGKTVLANQAAADIFGFGTVERTIGTTAMDYIPEEDREQVIREIAEDMAGGLKKVRDIRIRTDDGSIIWVSVLPTMTNYQGKPAILMSLRDITDRKLAEEAVKESEKKYRQLVETIHEGIWVIDKDSNTTFVNPRMAEMLGYTIEEMMGKHLFTFMDERGVKVAKYNLEHRQQGIKEQHDFEFLRKDGARIYTSLETSSIIDDKGDYAGEIAGVQDTTERKETLEAMRLSQEWFRNLVESTTDWVWESRDEDVYSYSNPQVRNILGYEPEEILGKTLSSFASPEEADRLFNIFASAAKTGEPVRAVEHTFLHKKGYPVALETSAVPFYVPGETAPGYRGITRDITERQEAKSRLEQTLKKLERTMEGTIQSISRMVETRDPYTAGHQWRMTQLACAIAREEGLDSEFVEVVRIVGLLHDLGKIGIPSEILSKPGRLTDTEFAMIKAHSQIGYEILKTVDFPWPVADIVLQHHERLNGSGYPLGLHEEDISPEAKILAVADVVEAMSSHRPYRPSLGIDKALEEITQNSGILYDPDAVYACQRLFTQKGFKFVDQK